MPLSLALGTIIVLALYILANFAYMVVLPAMVLLFLAGVSFGVRLGAAEWLEMTGLFAVALLPFVDSEVVLPFSTPVDAHARTEAISGGAVADSEGKELDTG